MTAHRERVVPHILLVDDNPDDLTLIQHACQDASLPAIFHLARDAAQARERLTHLATQGSPPDLIVLDILLPDCDGFQVLRELARPAERPPVPVLILTASADMRHVHRCFRLGADLYLYKPVVYDDKQVIAQRIAELLERQVAGAQDASGRRPGGEVAQPGAEGGAENDAAARRAS